MTRSPTFSPAAETTTPPQTSGPAAPRPSSLGPTSPASLWLHNQRIAGRRSAHPAFRQSADAKLTVTRCRQGTGAKHHRQVLRRADGEAAADLPRAAGDRFPDSGRAQHLAVEDDRKRLADIGARD